MMKRLVFSVMVLAFLLGSSTVSFSQPYSTGVGLRLGSPSGITVKHFFASKTALEGMLSFGWGGLGITGLYEINNEIRDTPGLDWYYGFGAHIASATSNPSPWGNDNNNFYLGGDGIIGLEYTFSEAPISIAVDAMPVINLVESPSVWLQGGISFRYNFQ